MKWGPRWGPGAPIPRVPEPAPAPSPAIPGRSTAVAEVGLRHGRNGIASSFHKILILREIALRPGASFAPRPNRSRIGTHTLLQY
jgi:hypothetical protein